jgi:multisubunit Na+/H+ antiporter MnhB subunit
MFLIGLTVTAVGFILALAVHPENPGSVNVNTVGWILVVVGLVAFLTDMLLWATRGRPGYLRRTTVMNDSGYGGAYPMQGGYGPRRRVIEEEEAGPPGPGY